MARISLLGLVLLAAVSISIARGDEKEEGFVSLFDGKTLNGWKVNENPETFTLRDGAIVAKGDRSHLFYVGDERPFTNFELKVDVMTEPGSNGGIYFHTRWQESGWPRYGFEAQVNNSHSDWRRTGSLYGVQDVREAPAQDNKWFTEHIIVQGKRVVIKVDGKTVVDYIEPERQESGRDFTRKIDSGTFALQGHDPKSVVHYKNIRVKRLD